MPVTGFRGCEKIKFKTSFFAAPHSHLPRGRWLFTFLKIQHSSPISIHTFLAEGDKRAICRFYQQKISIHTFLAEGDIWFIINELISILISIHTFLTEGDLNDRYNGNLSDFISIHTFLTEGDQQSVCLPWWQMYFNPHLPRGRWRYATSYQRCSDTFQSTPSSRKVTL